jgi:hypothetical protein
MARTLLILLLFAAVGCRGGGDRDAGPAPRGFYTPRSLRGTEPPDAPVVGPRGELSDRPIEEQQRRGRARYGIPDQAESPDARQRYNNPPDRYGPTGR